MAKAQTQQVVYKFGSDCRDGKGRHFSASLERPDEVCRQRVSWRTDILDTALGLYLSVENRLHASAG